MNTISIPLAQVAASEPRRRLRLRHASGFWVIAAAFLAVMAFSTLPTPLYAYYQQRDGFPTWAITVIFAAYAAGVIVSLFFIGHISDWAGRRPLVLVAIVFQLIAAVIFIFWNDVSGLIVARFICGVGVGALTATATAHLSELRAVSRPDENPPRAGMISTVVNMGGLGLGPLIAGALAQFLPLPLLVPYLVFLAILAVAAIAVALVPETVERPEHRPVYRPQRISLPEGAGKSLVAAIIATFAGFAVFGLFASLAPTVLAGTLHDTSPLVAGVAAFAVFAAAALSQVLMVRVSERVQLRWSVGLIVVGLLALGVGTLAANLPLFVASAVLAGAGVGLQFRSAIGVAASLAAPDRKGEVLALIFLAAYIGLAVPALIIGVVLIVAPVVPVVLAFAVVTAVLVVWAGLGMLRAHAR
jgi:MFS family permease